MATFRGLAPELLEPFVTKIFFQSYSMQPLMYEGLFNTAASSRAFEEYFAFAGFGRFTLKPEGVPVAYDDPVQGDRKRVVILTFALAFRVTMEMMEDDQHGIISRLPSDLGEAARDSQERLAWGLYNDGFAGSTYTGYPEGDGTRRSLWNTGHVPLRNPNATQSNRLNPGVALSVAGLQTALTMFRTAQGEEERFITVNPKSLVFHPDNEWVAAQLLDSQQEPYTSDNQVNAIGTTRTGLQSFRTGGVPYITDTDSWSIWADKGQHSVTYINRKSLNMSEAQDSQSFDRMFISHYRAQVDFNEWRGTVGSAP